LKEAIVGLRDTAVSCLTSPNCNRAYASIRVCMCVGVFERKRWGGRERETHTPCGRKNVCVCVCVRNHSVVPGFALHENTCVYDQVLQNLLAASYTSRLRPQALVS
jgi:hypothetical protein